MENGQPMIDVDYLSGEPTYNTLAEATAAAARKGSRGDIDSVRSKAIVNYQYVGDSLFLLLAGGTVLQILAGITGVEWRVIDRYLLTKCKYQKSCGYGFPIAPRSSGNGRRC